jgi:DNA helicase IV
MIRSDEMVERNQEWEKEQKRVNRVISEVEKQADQLIGKTEEMKKEIVELRKTFWEDVTVNVDVLDGGTWAVGENSFPDKWNEISRFTKEKLRQKELPYEDVTPFLYLCHRLKGEGSHTGIRHLFIDEAQDYSPFQFVYFKEVFSNARMTILGDIHQAIYAHAVRSLTSLNQEIEEEETFENIVLTKSYRSTREIVGIYNLSY